MSDEVDVLPSSHECTKCGVQPPSAFCGTFQFHQQALGARLPNSLDCGAQFIRVDALFKFAQDRSVAHSSCGFYDHRFWARTARPLRCSDIGLHRTRIRLSQFLDLASWILSIILPLRRYSKKSR